MAVPDALEAAAAAYREARDAIPAAQEEGRRLVTNARSEADRARQRLAAAIVAAARRGTRQKDIVAKTGYTRETVRTILRAAGIEAE